jgi:hypothetical protein
MKKTARLRLEAVRRAHGVCISCGYPRDNTYIPIDVCSGCQVNPYIPKWFAKHEKYVFDEVWGYENATEHPKSGKAIIDTPKPRHVILASQVPE